MKHFTVHQDPEVDARVQHDLALIRDGLLAEVPEAEALVLVGAFGRGEGTVVRGPTGPRAYNDYDLVLVHPRRVAVPDLTPRRRELARALGVTHVDVEVLESEGLAQLPPTMHAHDLKHGGWVLHGNPEVLARVPDIAGSAVDAGAARLLLFNRLTCLLECVRAPFFAEAPEGAERFWMAYMTAKVMLSVGAALLVRRGLYHHGYRERLARFRNAFAAEPELVRMLEVATALKVDPPPEVEDPRPAWFAVRARYLALVKEMAEEALGERFAGWDALAKAYEGDRARDAFRKVKWWVLDRRKHEDIVNSGRRKDVELAEIYLTAAVREAGGFDPELTARGRERLAAHAQEPLADWESCRVAAVRLDLTHVHPT